MGLHILLTTALLSTPYICQQKEGDKADCLTRDQFAEALGPKMLAMADEVWQDYGNSAIMFDADNQLRIIQLQEFLGELSFSYKLSPISYKLSPISYKLSPISYKLSPNFIPWPYTVLMAAGLGVEEDAGVNTDGQLLYGPPGSVSGWYCDGYLTVDSCKACCMATRSTLIGAIAALAIKCHAAASINPWVHAACAVAEATAAGLVFYNMDKCNGNCEKPFWNDTSLSWAPSSSSPLGADYDTCEGRLTWGMHNGCWLPAVGEGCPMVDSLTPIIQEIFRMPEYSYIRVIGKRTEAGFAPEDYRIVDVDAKRGGNQTPYVGIVNTDEIGHYLVIEKTGEKLYLDNAAGLGAGQKIWAYGSIENAHMNVAAYGVL